MQKKIIFLAALVLSTFLYSQEDTTFIQAHNNVDMDTYGNYDHYKSLFQTMETLCRLQNTVAPWQPESTYNWTVQDLMLHIEKHRDESLDFNPLVQAPTAVGSSKAVNAVSMSFEDFKKRWTQSQSTRSAGTSAAFG